MALEFALLIVIFAAIVVSATFLSHIFSEVTRLPRLVFYIIVGLILGPLFLNLLNPDILTINEGQFLEAVVAVAVAVIVFEGGYSFNRCLPHEQACSPIEFRQLIGNVLRLSLIGGLITAALMILVFLFVAVIIPTLALLMGVLTMITGPTVINPVVRRLGIKEDVAFTLEGEGLINDAIGVIIASAIFTAIQASLSGIPIALPVIVTVNLLIGVLAGFTVGSIGVFISQWIGPRFNARYKDQIDTHSIAHLSRIGMLIVAFAAFAFAETFAHDAGIVAALIAGIMLGNRDKFGIGPEIDWEDYESYDMKRHIEEGVHTFQSDLPASYRCRFSPPHLIYHLGSPPCDTFHTFLSGRFGSSWITHSCHSSPSGDGIHPQDGIYTSRAYFYELFWSPWNRHRSNWSLLLSDANTQL